MAGTLAGMAGDVAVAVAVGISVRLGAASAAFTTFGVAAVSTTGETGGGIYAGDSEFGSITAALAKEVGVKVGKGVRVSVGSRVSA